MKHQKALLIVDLQCDFLEKGALPVPHSNQIIQPINQAQEDFDLIIATQDWHPLNHKSFAINHPHKKPFDTIPYRGYQQTLWPKHCIQGSPGARLSPKLNTNKIKIILRKGTNPLVDSYSAFFDNEKNHPTSLEPLLKAMNVKHLFLCGLAADYCLYYTALDAKSLQFNVYFLTQLTKPISLNSYQQAIDHMKKEKIHVI